MPLPTFPAIAWGSVDDCSASPWTSSGTISATGGQTDPFGGTNAAILNDTDAGVQAARLHAGLVLAAPGTLVVCIKASTATGYIVVLRDTTASAVRIQDNGSFSSNVPVPSMATGTNLGVIKIGSGSPAWYALLYSAAGLVPGNTHRLELYPCGNTASLTGATYFFVQNIAFLDLIDNAMSFKKPKPGYLAAVTPSGTRDAWKVGTDDPMFAGKLRWITPYAVSGPVVKSGWYGAAESPGCNAGLLAALQAGWNMNVLTFIPDRTAFTSYVTGYLTKPEASFQPTLESGIGQYSVDLELTLTSDLVVGV